MFILAELSKKIHRFEVQQPYIFYVEMVTFYLKMNSGITIYVTGKISIGFDVISFHRNQHVARIVCSYYTLPYQTRRYTKDGCLFFIFVRLLKRLTYKIYQHTIVVLTQTRTKSAQFTGDFIWKNIKWVR